MAITTTSSLPAPVQQSFSYQLLSVPFPYLIHNIPATRKTMPRNGGRILRMRRYNPLATAVVPLGNTGVTPPAQQLSAVDIDALIQFYGSYVIINEQVSLQNQDPVLTAAAQRLGESLRKTEDQLTRDMLSATAAAINAVGGVNGDNPTEITRSDVDDAIRTLVNADAHTIEQHIEGEDRFGTAPVRDAFFALGSTQLIGDLERVDGFSSKNNYPDQRNTLRSEWGAVSNMRFLLSSVGSVAPTASTNANDVYNIFCVGMDAYAYIEQDGYSANFIYRPPMYDGPLALNSSAGYKFAAAPRITNDAWVLNLRVTLSV